METDMLKTIYNWLGVNQAAHISECERFILSKNPKTLADIEYWSRAYDRRNLKGGLHV